MESVAAMKSMGVRVLSVLLLGLLLCSGRAHADVKLTSGEYHDTFVDLQVKVLGGYVTVQRTWFQDQWHFNRAWNSLKFQYDNLDGSLKSIERNGDVFKKANGEGTLFTFGKRRSIVVSGEGLRWQDRNGNWITYDKTGRITTYGDRYKVKVTLAHDAAGRLAGVFDHHGKQVLWYEYASDGQPIRVWDRVNREVRYTYTADRLTTVTDVLGNAWQYTYDAKGRLATCTDPEGRTITVTYDPLGRVLSVKSQDGSSTEYHYDYDRAKREFYIQMKTSGGRVEEAWYQRDGLLKRHVLNGQIVQKFHTDGRKIIRTDHSGNQTTQVYDEWDNLLERIYPDGSTVRYAYENTYSNIVQITDEKSIVTQYAYDDYGNLRRATEAVGTPQQRITEHRYDGYGNRTESWTLGDANSAETHWAFTYDDYGNPLTVTNPEGDTTRYTYDVMGNVLTRTDPRGKGWVYTYDNAGRLRSAADPLGHPIRYAYDKVGNLTEVVDADNHKTLYGYDARNNLTRVTDAAGNTTEYTYDADGKRISETDQEGKSRTFEYTRDGRPRTVIKGSVAPIHLAYPDDGQTNSGGVEQALRIRYPTYERHIAYDRRNRPVLDTVVLNDGESLLQRLGYDTVGALISETDPEGRTTSYDYDALYNLIKATDTLGHVTQGIYDSRNNLIALTDALGNTTHFAYDKNDRLIQVTRPLGQVVTYAYDAAGSLVHVIDTKGQKIGYAYDDVGRQTATRYYPTGNHDTPQETIIFSYDNRGNLTSWSAGTTSATYTYDALQRLTSMTLNYGPFSPIYSYTYSKNGLKKTFTGPDGVTYEYTYDANNRLASVKGSGLGTITFNAYQWQVPEKITLPGGTTREYKYNGLLNVERIQVKDPAHNPVVDLQYSYNRMQQVQMQKVRTQDTESGTSTYTYDDAYRLIQAAHSQDGNEDFILDAVGNRIRASITMSDWRYNANNQLLGQGDSAYEYDANGNLIRKTTGATERYYFYDIADRLIRVEEKNGAVIARYGYDPFGRRLWKEVEGVKTYYFYAEEGLIGEFDASGKQLKAYGYRPDSPWGTDPLYMKAPDGYYFYHNDHLGTPHKFTAANGAVAWSASYSAFGTARIQSGSSITNNLRFPGQYYDAETGLHYSWHRYYDPETGRYITADPIGIKGGINLYTSVRADPVNYLDPYGLYTLRDALRDIGSYIREGVRYIPYWIPCIGPLVDFIECPTLEAGYWTATECVYVVEDMIVGRGVGEIPGAFIERGSARGGIPVGERLPDGRIAGDGPGAALRNGPDFHPSLGAYKKALRDVHKEVGKLPKGQPGKFGSPQAGTPKKGYRLDPPHPNAPLDSPEAKHHFNWWDYTEGKKGTGGRSGAIPIED